MIVFFAPNIDEGQFSLNGDEFVHCTKVLRHRVGDHIYLVDGKGLKAEAKILEINKRDCLLEVVRTERSEAINRRLAIAIAPTKNISRFEWFLEKATEIGITDIYPLIMKHSERKRMNVTRSEKIVRTAFKQSLRKHLPNLHPLQSLDDFLGSDLSIYKNKVIAHYVPDQGHLKDFSDKTNSCLVLIGPEGDFDADERTLCSDEGFLSMNISSNRLRTETAGIVALQYIL